MKTYKYLFFCLLCVFNALYADSPFDNFMTFYQTKAESFMGRDAAGVMYKKPALTHDELKSIYDYRWAGKKMPSKTERQKRLKTIVARELDRIIDQKGICGDQRLLVATLHILADEEKTGR